MEWRDRIHPFDEVIPVLGLGKVTSSCGRLEAELKSALRKLREYTVRFLHAVPSVLCIEIKLLLIKINF